MRKKIIPVVIITTAVFTSYNTYKFYNKEKMSDVLLSNIEALADDSESSDNNVYPRYINTTDKNRYKEFKIEGKTDSTGKTISIHYSRTCTTYYTYCKHTGKKDDICYGSLNGKATDCGSWTKD